ncbi:hypothetical protein JXJ21_08315 [candidate division KSB1 bacterium]|nr:hypothetical protein [candidate division KSB1 bacterium]
MNEQTQKILFGILGVLKLLFIILFSLLMFKLTFDAVVLFYSYIFKWDESFYAVHEVRATSTGTISPDQMRSLENLGSLTFESSSNDKRFSLKKYAPTTQQAREDSSAFIERVESIGCRITDSEIKHPLKSPRIFRLELSAFIPLIIFLIFYYRYLYRLYKDIKAAPADKRLAVIAEIKYEKKEETPAREVPKPKSRSGKRKKKRR